MLPEYIISKFRSRIGLLYSPHSRPQQYLHSRRRYYNSIPLLSIVALLVIMGISICPDMFSPTSSAYATEEYNVNYGISEDYGISPLAATAGLSIGSTGKITGNTTPGNVAYASNTITATASDVSSYTLSITGPVGLEGGTTITGANNNTPANMADNTWGYAYNDSNSNENKTYKSFTGSAQTLESGTTPSGVAKDITFAAKFGEDAANGHYMADITLSLVATPATTTYTITYNANGGSNAPTSTTCVAQGDSGTSCTTTLSSTKPTRTNYTFLGWSTSNSAITASYQAGGNISVTKDTTLYAIWKDARTMGSITYMQDVTSDICANTATGAAYTLTDRRDGNKYTVRKFNDDRCWMTQNLKIVNKTVSSSDSDMTSGTFPIPASSTSGFSDNADINAYVSDNTGYYTWCAATAGTCSSATSDGVNATNSICPKGWKLPTGSEFRKFTSSESIGNSTEGSSKIQTTPYNFAYTGRMEDSGSIKYPGDGFWWTSTASGSGHAYTLNIADSYVLSGNRSQSAHYGMAVRCIAK